MVAARNPAWCAETAAELAVPVVRLATLLEMLPARLEYRYIKVDTEGNDLHVLRGVGLGALRRFAAVTIECQDYAAGTDAHARNMMREGGCTVDEAVAFASAAFPVHRFDRARRQGNLHLAKSEAGLAYAEAMMAWLVKGTRPRTGSSRPPDPPEDAGAAAPLGQ